MKEQGGEHEETPRTQTLYDFTGARKIIFARVRESGITYASLSRAIGRNAAYMHQYMFKGTPKYLDEDARIILADMLGITPDELREGRSRLGPKRVDASLQVNQDAARITAGVPLFRETESIDLTRASNWVPPIGSSISFAVWIERPRKKLTPGDIVFAKPNYPVRTTDQVVILEKGRVVGLGEAHAVGAKSITVESALNDVEFDRENVQIFKVAGVTYP